MNEQMNRKIDEAKRKAGNNLKRGIDWAYANKEILMFAVPIVIGGIAGTAKFATKHYNLKKQETLKNLYCYDRSLGHYWKLKRELSNAEWTSIGKRKNSGEKLVDILSELKVLS